MNDARPCFLCHEPMLPGEPLAWTDGIEWMTAGGVGWRAAHLRCSPDPNPADPDQEAGFDAGFDAAAVRRRMEALDE